MNVGVDDNDKFSIHLQRGAQKTIKEELEITTEN
jgi:hypothetical protein